MTHPDTSSLRSRLIDAGLEILADKGTAALTLRACAARAGVSHAAPAHHFDGLPGLLAGIAKVGFDLFAATMIEDRKKGAADPRAQLIGIGHGYLRFARENPGLFTLMFNSGADLLKTPDLTAAAEASYDVLRSACAPFEPVGPHPTSTEIMVWSLVHGMASLTLGQRFGPPDAASPAPGFADILPALTLRNPQPITN